MNDADEHEDVEAEEFLRKADAVYGEYDQGYVDADASLRQLREHIREFRARVEDD